MLDELVGVEIDGGRRLIQIRDQLSKLLFFLRGEGLVTFAESSNAMRGVVDVVQILRTRVADQYRAEAEGNLDVVREDFQPPANYTDTPK